jgi:membrane-bound lytic murein transglycosylase D
VKAGRIVGADSLLQRVKCSSDYSNIKSDKTFSVENNASHTIPAVYHKVRKGENLSAIASKYNVTVSQIKRLNNLKSTNLQINQQLKIKEKVTVKVPEQELAQQESIPIKSELLSEKKTDENLDIASSHGSEKHDLNTGEHSKGFEKTNEIRSVSKFHKVTKGETLFSIARANNLSIEKLKEINNLRDGKIMPGQKLLVSVNQNKSVKSEKQSEQKSIEHKVIAGESLFSIANKYNVSVDDIRTANNLSGTKIKVGQMLTIDRVQQSL